MLFSLLLACFGPPLGHAEFLRLPSPAEVGPDDHNLNFVNGRIVDPAAIAVTDAQRPLREALARQLELPASLVASFVAIAEDRDLVQRNMAYGYHFSPGLDWEPQIRGRDTMSEFTRKAVQRIAAELRAKRGEKWILPGAIPPEEALRPARDEVFRRPPPRVQILVGDRGPVGKSALYLYYTLAARRERHALHDHTRAADLADYTQKQIAHEDRPVFVVDDWTRQDVELRRILLTVLEKNRDLFAGSSIVITTTSEAPIGAATTPADVDPQLVKIADAIHFVPRPSSPAKYARLIGRWNLRALDEDSRHARLLGLEAYELQELAKASVVGELKTALETGVLRCGQALDPRENAQRQILHDEIQTYRKSLRVF